MGVSPRHALSVKKLVLTAIEQEHRQDCYRVEIHGVGVLCGFDQFYVRTTAGIACALVWADGRIPYRTSSSIPERYAEQEVLASAEKDFEQGGIPLVVRADRWKAHDAPRVRQFFEQCRVLLLHGPAHYPSFYGQLERQNREHRAWFRNRWPLDRRDLKLEADRMIRALNRLYRRRMLGWQTPEEVWRMEKPPVLDRQSLREEVDDRTARLALELRDRPNGTDLARRLIGRPEVTVEALREG